MNSQQVKQTFQAAGIKVRVADLGLKFRVCTLGNIAFNRASATTVAASIGLTDVMGSLGGQFNQDHELIGYKPGRVRII